MRQRLQKITKEVKKQTNPEIQFVSIVNRGANQTPFNVVKSEVNGMSKQGDEPILNKIVFKKDSFEDLDSVKTYLSEKGYEIENENDISDKDETFVIVAKADDEFESIEEISEEGVTRFIGVLKTEEISDEETPKDVKKDDENASEVVSDDKPETSIKFETEDFKTLSSKYNNWDAEYSTGETLNSVLADGVRWSTAVPALGDIVQAAGVAIANSIKSGDTANIKVVTSDLSKAANSLAKIFGDIYKEDTVKAEEIIAFEDKIESKKSADKSDEKFTEVDEKFNTLQETVNTLTEDLKQISIKQAEVMASINSQQEEVVKKQEDQFTTFESSINTLKAAVDEINSMPQVPNGIEDESDLSNLEEPELTKKEQELDDKIYRDSLGLGISLSG